MKMFRLFTPGWWILHIIAVLLLLILGGTVTL